jgi:hypothetical protein
MADTSAKPTPDSAKQYVVSLARAIQIVPSIWARPADHVILQGDQIAGYGDAILRFEEV